MPRPQFASTAASAAVSAAESVVVVATTSVQIAAPSRIACLPAGQDSHPTRSARPNVPAAHTRQLFAPAPGWYVPPRHSRHSRVPALCVYLPAGHAAHASASLALYLPAGQLKHVRDVHVGQRGAL